MKQRILLSFDSQELKEFKTVINNSNNQTLQNLVKLVTERQDTDEFIKRKVFEALSDLSNCDIDEIKVDQNLKNHLGLTIYHKKSLKTYFQRIINELNANAIISVRECEILTNVSTCIQLIKSKL
ncbi:MULTISPECIES: hypothetical protein [Tenacibaculum]|uniref:hypothetical protein n=1 Tax=Tenacibaculum TaxID=104267 RepID=UPI00089AC76E|nr:hypothetical protein [Tenacibaculum sp. MAR_2010_89]SEE63018.1 hypothetical protein SAMN04487765_3473 [Tenacibaculum sp. MAR_2010_89]